MVADSEVYSGDMVASDHTERLDVILSWDILNS